MQPVGTEKSFSSDEWARQSYNYIKALKNILGIHLNSYLLKKLLMRPAFQSLKFGATGDGRALFRMLSQPALKRKFEGAIDFDQWAKSCDFKQQYIPLRERD